MGSVFLAEDLLEGGRLVALKSYPEGSPADSLRREFLALRRLRHPAIARAFHFFAPPVANVPFFSMEYLEGDNVETFLGRRHPEGPRPGSPAGSDRLVLAVELFAQCASALGYLHRHELLHLDVKPDNILVLAARGDQTPLAVLIDLGLVHGEGQKERDRRGTPGYVAPERVLGSRPDARVDLYALGVTFHRLLTGKSTSGAETRRERIEEQVHGDPHPGSGLPLGLARLLRRLLARDPSRRYSSAREVVEGLRALHRELSPQGGLVLPRADEVSLEGRERELRILEGWLRSDRRLPPILTFRGPAGIGKSRILDELEAEISGRGLPVLLFRPGDGGELEALERLVGGAALLLPPSASERATFSHLFGSTGLCPRVGKRPGRRRSGANRLARSGPRGLAAIRRQAVRWLAERIRDRCLVLVVDDLEFGGPATQGLVVELGREVSAEGPSPGIPGGIITSRVQGDLGDPRIESVMDLEPLDPEAVGRWCQRSSVDVRTSRALVERVYRRSGGIPLLVALEWDAVIEESSPTTDTPVGPTGGSSSQARLQARLDAALERHRAVLETLATLTLSPTVEGLARAIGLTESQIAPHVRLLEADGLLRSDPSGRLSFVHESIAPGLLRGVSRSRRREIHRRCARLRARTPRELTERAHHLFEAGESAAAVKTAAALLDLPPLDPARRSPLARDVLERAGSRRELPAMERWRFLDAAAELILESGHPDRTEALWRPFLRVRGLPASTRAAIARRRARALHLTGNVRKAERLLVDALRRLDAQEHRAERLSCLVDLASIAHTRQAPRRAEAWAREGLEIWPQLPAGERSCRRQEAVHLHAILGQVALRSLRFEDAIEILERGERIARESDVNAGFVLNNLGVAYHLASRFGRALRAFDRARGIAELLSDESMRIPILCNVAQIQGKLARFEEARETLVEADRSPAISASSRLELSVRFSAALVDHLETGSRPEVWSELGSRFEGIGDRFLAGFARLYEADAALLLGHWSLAASRLRAASLPRSDAPPSDPVARRLGALAASRLACLESELGRRDAAENALDRSAIDSPEKHDYLGAWSSLYSGLARARLHGAPGLEELGRAETFFRRHRVVAGLAEALVRTAEAALVTGQPRACERALGRLDRYLSPRRRVDVRHARLRASLIRARLELAGMSLLDDPGSRVARIADLLAEGEGDPAFDEIAPLRVQAAAVRDALARITGSSADRRAAREGLDRVRHVVAENLAAKDRQALLGLEVFAQVGLPSLAPTTGSRGSRRGWGAETQHAVERMAEEASLTEGGENHAQGCLRALLDPLEGLAAAWLVQSPSGQSGGWHVEASWPPRAFRRCSFGRLLSRLPPLASSGDWAALGEPTSRIWASDGRPLAPRVRSWLSTPLPSLARGRSAIVVLGARPRERVTAEDLRLLRTASYLLWRAAGPDTRPPVGARGPNGPVSRGEEITRPLERTRRLESSLATGSDRSRSVSRTPLVNRSPALRRAIRTIQSVSATDLPVLLSGEPGTGKDTLARLIHELSDRRDAPFVTQNLGAIPEALLEADLFGRRRGAFTGADTTRSGFLLQAQGGTFLIDEIGELDAARQGKLLRVLAEGYVRPVGGDRGIPLDVRFLATTRCDLEDLVERGRFRSDLYFRLRGAHIHLPPLRERPEDIVPLLKHFFLVHAGFEPRCPAAVRDRLIAHPWPGNAHELETLVRRLALRPDPVARGALQLGDVDEALGPARSTGLLPAALLARHSFEELQGQLERQYLEHLFERHEGDLEAIATVLGTSVRSLYRRLERHGLRPRDLERRLGPWSARDPGAGS